MSASADPQLRPVCAVHCLGQVDYEQAWRLQERLAHEIAGGERPASLLLLEHPHTFTFGRRGQAENCLWDAPELARRGVKVHWVDRGGDITYHGPGQLVGYPLLPLAPGGLQVKTGGEKPRLPRANYVGYVRMLEEMLILALERLGVSAVRREGLTGVWVSPRPGLPQPAKIAAIGVKVDVHGVSRHGFALNVQPDMSYWQGIIGCGLKDTAVTRMVDLLEPAPAMETVMQAVEIAFAQVFAYQLVYSREEFFT